jgi:hypothetical protein
VCCGCADHSVAGLPEAGLQVIGAITGSKQGVGLQSDQQVFAQSWTYQGEMQDKAHLQPFSRAGCILLDHCSTWLSTADM